MKKNARWGIPLMLSLGLYTVSGIAHSESDRQAAARQMKEDTTAQARYNTSRKEANAAYSDALKACRSMNGKEKTDCTKEAQHNLQNDLAQAHQTFQSEQSMGSSGGSSHHSHHSSGGSHHSQHKGESQ